MFQLLFPRWRKKNKRFDLLSWAIAFAVAIAVGFALPQSAEQQSAIAILVCFATRNILAVVFNRLFVDSVIGSVRLDYNDIEWQFRKLFKDDAILFHKRTENNAHNFEFPDHKLRVSLHDRSTTRGEKRRPIAQIKFHQVTSQNRPFVDTLTNAIDEMADQPAEESS